jgi:linoleoyl-CoA desaturase
MTPKSLTRSESDAFGRALDELRAETVASLGQADVDHIRSMIRVSRYAEAGGRLLLALGWDPASFVAGVAALSTAKILDNMEIGHNVMHGQYDWTRDPELDSRAFHWDMACDEDDWRRSHNHEHHTHTNIVGKDRDVGYGFLRLGPEQAWHPLYLGQPLYASLLAFFFQWGIGLHDLRLDELVKGRRSPGDVARRARGFLAKAAAQLGKDYLLFPALATINAPRVLAGNLLANMLRNLWSFGIIFCGHFPAGARLYEEQETRDESRGEWYLRQMNGSANIEGGALFHVLSGHLSHQIEHHLFPDIPAARYPAMAPRVRAICEQFGQGYCTGSFRRQLGSVARRIVRNALPPALLN